MTPGPALVALVPKLWSCPPTADQVPRPAGPPSNLLASARPDV